MASYCFVFQEVDTSADSGVGILASSSLGLGKLEERYHGGEELDHSCMGTDNMDMKTLEDFYRLNWPLNLL